MESGTPSNVSLTADSARVYRSAPGDEVSPVRHRGINGGEAGVASATQRARVANEIRFRAGRTGQLTAHAILETGQSVLRYKVSAVIA